MYRHESSDRFRGTSRDTIRSTSHSETAGSAGTAADLRRLLQSIDHRGYPAYKQTSGRWSYGSYTLRIDHVQGDPFASPSKVSIFMPAQSALFPKELYQQPHRRIALQDHLLRCFGKELAARERSYAGSGKSGLIAVSRPGQEILERTALKISPSTGDITVRFEIGFPANGRTINVSPLLEILEDFLPGAAASSLQYKNQDKSKIQSVIFLADDQKYIRDQLSPLGLCAFVADGSILPRQSGISSLPMKEAVPFVSPKEMAVTLQLPHKGALTGMGISRGVTLIVGGGYHGKSTLLQALERGVYDHIRGDGREFVITDETAVKVRAEDGRSIAGTDISLFIHDLPNGKDTVKFFTEDASGSTSQAANVIEAWEAGTRLLLMDEDTSATNFMVRDELMASVVSREKEPITPFISRIRALYEKAGISTILVAGSSGAFFHVADTVIQMDRYCPVEITGRAKEAAAEFSKTQKASGGAGKGDKNSGDGLPEHSASGGGLFDEKGFHVPEFHRVIGRPGAWIREGRIKLKVLSEDSFLLQKDEVELRAVEQIVDREQTAALAYLLKYVLANVADGRLSLQETIEKMQRLLKEKGLETLFDGGCITGGMAYVRKEEIFAMLSRYRKLQVR